MRRNSQSFRGPETGIEETSTGSAFDRTTLPPSRLPITNPWSLVSITSVWPSTWELLQRDRQKTP
jgi:hypothetical protein